MSHLANDIYIENIIDQMHDLKIRMQDVDGEEYNKLFDEYMILEQEKRSLTHSLREWECNFVKTTPRKIYVIRELDPKDEFMEQERINYDKKYHDSGDYS